MRPRIALAGIPLIALSLTGCIGSPFDTHSLSNPSLTYLGTLDEEGKVVTPENQLSQLICNELDRVDTDIAVHYILAVANTSGFTDVEAFELIVTAVVDYCPWHASDVSRSVSPW